MKRRSGSINKSHNPMPKKKVKLTSSEQEELKLLRERNTYLEAENIYLKKLRALVQERIQQEQKKK